MTFDLQSTRGHRWSQCPQAASGSMENPYRTGRPTHSWYMYTLLDSATEHCVSAAQIWSACSSMRCSNDFHSWISAFLEVSLGVLFCVCSLSAETLVQGARRTAYPSRVLWGVYQSLWQPRGSCRCGAGPATYQQTGALLSHSIPTGNTNMHRFAQLV